jgi:hypothetical protein
MYIYSGLSRDTRCWTAVDRTIPQRDHVIGHFCRTFPVIVTNVLSGYGFPIAAAVILGLIVWGPTLYSVRRKRRSGERVSLRHVCIALFIELAALLALGAIIQFSSLRDPEGYLLAIALLVGAIGSHVFSSMKFKHDV